VDRRYPTTVCVVVVLAVGVVSLTGCKAQLKAEPTQRPFSPSASLNAAAIPVAVRYLQSWHQRMCEAVASQALSATRGFVLNDCRRDMKSERRSLRRVIAWRIVQARMRKRCLAESLVLSVSPPLISRSGYFDCVAVHQEGLSCEASGRTIVDTRVSVFLARREGRWRVAYSTDNGESVDSATSRCTPDEQRRFTATTRRT
jgi:hypothetical protein